MDENLKSLEQLFKSDSAIKEMLLKVAPQHFSGQDAAVEYSDSLMDAIEDINFEMHRILSQPVFSISENMRETIEKKIAGIKNRIQSTSNLDELRKIYKESFSDMSEDFVKDVGNVCAGYGMNNHVYINGRTVNLLSVTSDAKSINEMLHLVHSYVCNNEYVLNKMPVTEIKNIDQYCKCTLFGVPNDIAQDIFDNYPTEGEKTEIGETYIIGLEDRTLMMVRDMGHALTIDIEEDKEKQTAFVKYFIPKVCNFDKVNKLRGINTVNNNGYWLDAYATGMYEAPVEGFGKDMVDFINQVPTDRDIMLSFTTGRREIKEIARMDINENITESEIQNASNVIAGIKKEREDKYL